MKLLLNSSSRILLRHKFHFSNAFVKPSPSAVSLFSTTTNTNDSNNHNSVLHNNNNNNNKEKLFIFDTTLRDGEQSPGATLSLYEKLNIARNLSKLGVDICEAGFPIASPGDFESVKTIAKEIGPICDDRPEPMIICGLARALEKDIEKCYQAVQYAPKHRIHTFLATSDIHLKYKLKLTKKQCLEQAVKAVQFALTLCPDIEFSTEDAGRTDPKFLLDVVTAVIEAGAKTINMPDTVGYASPEEYGRMFAYIRENLPKNLLEKNVIFSTHCHNDLGLATANSLSAVLNGGARQVEATINGIGERAGNTALEEIVMALRTRPQHYPVYTTINSEEIMRTSRMVSRYTGISVQPNKAIVGANAFAHEAGIHQDGVLKHQATYEIMLPASVGLKQNKMILGKHSGKHAYKKRLESLGYLGLSNEQLDAFVERFKVLADEKKLVTDSDIIAIVENDIYEPTALWTLSQIHVTAGNQLKATATVTLKNRMNKEEKNYAAIGTGPVDAAFRAIRKALNIKIHLDEYNVKSITGGTTALGEVSVRIKEKDDSEENNMNAMEEIDDDDDDDDNTTNPQTGVYRKRSYIGSGTNTDILVASASAYVNAINRLLQAKEREAKIPKWNMNSNNKDEDKRKESTA